MRSAACAVTTLIASASTISFNFILCSDCFMREKTPPVARTHSRCRLSERPITTTTNSAPDSALDTGWGCRPSVNPVADTPPAMPPARYPVSIPSRRKYWPRRAPPRSAPASAGRGLNPNVPSRNRRPSPAPRPPRRRPPCHTARTGCRSPTARHSARRAGFARVKEVAPKAPAMGQQPEEKVIIANSTSGSGSPARVKLAKAVKLSGKPPIPRNRSRRPSRKAAARRRRTDTAYQA